MRHRAPSGSELRHGNGYIPSSLLLLRIKYGLQQRAKSWDSPISSRPFGTRTKHTTS
jgi:hypothetical protein